jgi:hypothetical protein
VRIVLVSGPDTPLEVADEVVQPLLHIRLGQPHVGYGVDLAETHAETAGRGVVVFTQLSLCGGDDPRRLCHVCLR